ncbi:MAG: hypothetical protein JO209_04955 [Acidisphaera sp.]|nr:hypothetical protein [Acidisphaera sp.]
MRTRRSCYLASTALVAAALGLAPMAARAQAAPGDPPARVGRLAVIQGTVSFHTAGEDHWEPATLNYPVTDGNAFWTEPQALAEIEITASSLWLSASTEFDVSTLDSRALQAVEPQGELYLHLRYLAAGETYTIQTPRGTVTLAANGRYDVVAGDTDHPTTVSVLDGAAQITGNNISLQVQANQTASITGTGTFQGSVGPLAQDAFLAAMVQREQPPAAQAAAAAPGVVQQMTGCQDLQQYGTWQPTSDYGEVWYPQVDPGWVPYREGSWSYVAPWGWTWVDAAPWGFAPFHYGRWVHVGERWGWAPVYSGAVSARPVYAPALVTFFGLGAAAAIGVRAGAFGPGPAFSHGNVGWVPLGPDEPYRPPYPASPTYIRNVNVTNVRNVTNITQVRNDITINRFANNAAATVVPAEAMAASRPVAREVQRVDPGQLAQVRPVFSRTPIAPTAETAGVTPAVARALRLPAPAAARPAAPGPAVNETVFRHAPGRLPEAPALRPAGAANPAAPAPHANEIRPGEATPPIPQAIPEARPGQPAAVLRPGAPGPEIRPGEPGRGGLPPLVAPHPPAGRVGEPATQAQPGPAGPSAAPAFQEHARPGPARPGAAPELRQASPAAPLAAPPAAPPAAPSTAQPPAPPQGVRQAPELHPAPPPQTPAAHPAPAAPAHAAPAVVHPAPEPPRVAAPPPHPAAAPPPPHSAAPPPPPHPAAAPPPPRPSPAPPPPRPAAPPPPPPHPAAPPPAPHASPAPHPRPGEKDQQHP